MRPIVGITPSYRSEIHAVAHAYVDAVESAGGAPLLLPAVDEDDSVASLCDRVDALVVPGGPAVTLGLVGSVPAELDATDPRRVHFEERILRRVRLSSKPILGICYGMQLLNAIDGGTVYGDVERQVDGTLTHSEKRGATVHPVEVTAGTRLHEALKVREVEVNSRHLQAVASVGSSYRVSAVAPDGVIEGIESEDGRVIGVQFHPERMRLAALFESFVASV